MGMPVNPVPVQQGTAQNSPLQKYLEEEAGNVMLEHGLNGGFDAKAPLDPSAMVAGVNGAGVVEAMRAAKAAWKARALASAEQDVPTVGNIPNGQPRQHSTTLDQNIADALATDPLAPNAANMSPDVPPADMPPPEGGEVPPPVPPPEGGDRVADIIAGATADAPQMNPFAEAVNDPNSIGQPQLPNASTIDAINAPPDPSLMNAGRIGASNINLKHFDDPADKQLIDFVAQAENGYRDSPQRRVQTHAETIEKAQSKATLESVLQKPASDKWHPEEMVAMYKIMEAQSQELTAIGKRVKEITDSGGTPDGELLAAFATREQRFRATQKTASGAAAEAGRLLNSLQAIKKSSSSTEYYRMVANSIEAGGGKNSIVERARMFADDPTVQQASSMVQISAWDKSLSAAMTLRYNMMLSSVRTHVANISGSTIIGAVEALPVKIAASMFSYAEYVFREAVPYLKPMEQSERVQFLQELPVEMAGFWAGTKNGLSVAKQLATGKVLPNGSKFIDEMGMRYDPTGIEGGAIKNAMTIPTRLLEAEDAFFKAVNQNMKLNTLAFRQSRGAADPEKAYSDILANPPEWMMQEAQEFAQKNTLTNDPSVYGSLLGGLAKWIAQGTSESFALKVLIPFVKTPANAMGYAFETAGFGAVLDPSGTYNKFVKGTPAERADVASRLMIGGGLWALIFPYWQDGKITGAGSANTDVRRAMQAQGQQENSILVDGKYYSMSRTDPMGMTLSIIAGGLDAFHNETTQDKFGTFMATMLSVIQISKDRSYLSGITEFIELMDSGSAKVAQSMAVSQGSSFILPNILRDAREALDPYQREMAFDPSSASKGILTRFEKYIQNATPALSKNLPPVVDANGDYVMNDGSAMWRGLIPIRVSKLKEQDPVSAMYLYHRTAIAKPSHLINIRGVPFQINTLALDDGQGWLYHEYQKMVGKSRHEMVSKFLEGGSWKKMAKEGDYGVGSSADDALTQLTAMGLRKAQADFLDYISDMDEYQPEIDGAATGKKVPLVLQYSKDDLKMLARSLRKSISPEESARVKELIDSGVYKEKKRKTPVNLPQQTKDYLNEAMGVEATDEPTDTSQATSATISF